MTSIHLVNGMGYNISIVFLLFQELEYDRPSPNLLYVLEKFFYLLVPCTSIQCDTYLCTCNHFLWVCMLCVLHMCVVCVCVCVYEVVSVCVLSVCVVCVVCA